MHFNSEYYVFFVLYGIISIELNWKCMRFYGVSTYCCRLFILYSCFFYLFSILMPRSLVFAMYNHARFAFMDRTKHRMEVNRQGCVFMIKMYGSWIKKKVRNVLFFSFHFIYINISGNKWFVWRKGTRANTHTQPMYVLCIDHHRHIYARSIESKDVWPIYVNYRFVVALGCS